MTSGRAWRTPPIASASSPPSPRVDALRLLLDQNLSPRLARALEDVYPGTVHVRDVGLARASDTAVWEHALAHGLTIVSKDADFHQRSFLSAPPPKVVWIRLGNCTTDEVENLLREHEHAIRQFADDASAAFLAVG